MIKLSICGELVAASDLSNAECSPMIDVFKIQFFDQPVDLCAVFDAKVKSDLLCRNWFF